MMKTKIKEWYMATYPTDELGEYLSESTFEELFDALDNYGNVYEVIGVCDSLVRERCFSKLAEIMGVDYNYIYQQWLRM